ncbi:MAG: phosphopantetheine-binding protein [Elusimicrobiota bacterium]|jgi:acyl carrier protein|nr:phosphopantetheine-binding protein [Elusimicrobiota bacterium]
MQKEEIIKIVNRALVKEFELDESLLTPEADFVSLGLDSLDAVDMVITLEQAFKVDIRNNYKVGDFGSLGGLYDFIEKLIKQKNNV